MENPQEAYLRIGRGVENATESQLFGKPCFKVGGKPFVSFFQNAMVFKLTGEQHCEALALEDAQLFDPSGKDRPMREWVQVPVEHIAKWEALAQAACGYVKSLS